MEKFTTILFQIVLVMIGAAALVALVQMISASGAISEAWAAFLGNLVAALAVGAAAWMGFKAQDRAARLQRENAQHARQVEAQGLAGTLASELMCARIFVEHYIESLTKYIAIVQSGTIKKKPPRILQFRREVFEANIGRLDLLPPDIQLLVVTNFAVTKADLMARSKTEPSSADALVERATETIEEAKKDLALILKAERELLKYVLNVPREERKDVIRRRLDMVLKKETALQSASPSSAGIPQPAPEPAPVD